MVNTDTYSVLALITLPNHTVINLFARDTSGASKISWEHKTLSYYVSDECYRLTIILAVGGSSTVLLPMRM